MTVDADAAPSTRDRTTALVLATLAFTTNFWAWGLLSPLAPEYRDVLGLSALQTSVLVATPVLLGSVFRVPIGALTDRFGGRAMYTGLSLAVVVPVVFLAAFESYLALLVGGFVLGLSGASFAIGIPFVNRWYPPERRGFALGIYGVGTWAPPSPGSHRLRWRRPSRVARRSCSWLSSCWSRPPCSSCSDGRSADGCPTGSAAVVCWLSRWRSSPRVPPWSRSRRASSSRRWRFCRWRPRWVWVTVPCSRWSAPGRHRRRWVPSPVFVGAAGGLGGFFPPLVMGAVFEATGSYAIGLVLLCLTAVAGMTYTFQRFVTRSAPVV